MTLLLIDVGNTRVKWARLSDGRLGKLHAAANLQWRADDYARMIGRGWSAARGNGPASARAANRQRSAHRPAHVEGAAGERDRIIVSSVASARVGRLIAGAARRAGAPTPEFVVSERRAGGVTTTYLEPWRLGVDRFVGAIGAHHLASGQPVCVVNVGTAITIDLVDQSGCHRGGAILPGPALMVESLLRHTNGIRRRARGGANGVRSLFARTTRTAIGQGSLYAAAAVIDRAVEESVPEVGATPLILLTGGGSVAVKPLLRRTCVYVPELVLHGLAVWAAAHPSSGGE